MKAKKRFGQHFLHDSTVIQRMLHFFAPQKTDNVVEIGPGLGALTKPLLTFDCNVTVVEIDREAQAYLKETIQNPHFHLVCGDALDIDYASLASGTEKIRCIGNLPYNISTPLIFHLLEFRSCIHDMLFMLQKEVVDRLVAEPNTSDYGRLTVMTQYFCKIDHLFNVGPEAFSPPPKVDSAIVYLKPYEELPVLANDFKLFQTIVRDAFNLRRKTIHNSLKSYLSDADWQRLGIEPTRRPETLSVKEFVEISNAALNLSKSRT